MGNGQKPVCCLKKNRAVGAVKSREETPKEGIYSHE